MRQHSTREPLKPRIIVDCITDACASDVGRVSGRAASLTSWSQRLRRRTPPPTRWAGTSGQRAAGSVGRGMKRGEQVSRFCRGAAAWGPRQLHRRGGCFGRSGDVPSPRGRQIHRQQQPWKELCSRSRRPMLPCGRPEGQPPRGRQLCRDMLHLWCAPRVSKPSPGCSVEDGWTPTPRRMHRRPKPTHGPYATHGERLRTHRAGPWRR